MAELRIFSYLPSPRVSKATIAARLCGVTLELRGAAAADLPGWLWDYDARTLSLEEKEQLSAVRRTARIGLDGATLFKTDAFLEAHPFGTVPAAFGADGKVGIFESNSIMRAVARLGEKMRPLYGRDLYEASRIDGFLDASLVFARETQIYLLSLSEDQLAPRDRARAKEALIAFSSGIEHALTKNGAFLVGNDVTIADICFASEFALLATERRRSDRLASYGLTPLLHVDFASDYPLLTAHFGRLLEHPAFKQELEPYTKFFAPLFRVAD